MNLDEIEIDRCCRKGDSPVSHSSLHSFSDASDIGYGEVSYLREIHVYGTVNVSFVMGKSRVAPLKKRITIPRLELCAAVTSAKVASLISDEMYGENSVERQFWSDSQIVIGYINNQSTMYRVFVGNRIQVIRDYTEPADWHYVPTKENPADFASRGLTASDTEKIDVWLNGPTFLKQIEAYLQQRGCDWINWQKSPPHASHMGGVWERLIRSMRSILNALIKDNPRKLDEDIFGTFLCEVECIMNSQPITVDNINDPLSDILTLNQLLTMKKRIVLPPSRSLSGA